MICDCCQKKCRTEKYDIYGTIVELCSECFTELQKEVVYVEGLDKDFYQIAFAKLGIVPKKRPVMNECAVCGNRFLKCYYRDGKIICEECFDVLSDIL